MFDLEKCSNIIKSNQLNESYFQEKITFQDYKFFLFYLSKINPDDVYSKHVKVRFSEYCDLMQIKKLNIKSVLKSLSNLRSHSFFVPNDNFGYDVIGLFDVASLQKINGEWVIDFYPNDKILPYIFNVCGYFPYKTCMLRLPSLNALRLYEILRQIANMKSRKYTIEELKMLLYMDNSAYPEFKFFRRDIIEKNVKIINELTDISVSYECGGTTDNGKTWTTIIFHVEDKPGYERNRRKMLGAAKQNTLFAQFMSEHIFESQISVPQSQKIIDMIINKINDYPDKDEYFKPDNNRDIERWVAEQSRYVFETVQDKIIKEDITIEKSLSGYVKQSIKAYLDRYHNLEIMPVYFYKEQWSEDGALGKAFNEYKVDVIEFEAKQLTDK